MTPTRETAIFGLWRRVNEIATTTEDTTDDDQDNGWGHQLAEIRKLIADAEIQPKIHVGTPPEDFTPLMVAEWCLGQWASAIDSGSGVGLVLVSRSSLRHYETIVGAAS